MIFLTDGVRKPVPECRFLQGLEQSNTLAKNILQAGHRSLS